MWLIEDVGRASAQALGKIICWGGLLTVTAGTVEVLLDGRHRRTDGSKWPTADFAQTRNLLPRQDDPEYVLWVSNDRTDRPLKQIGDIPIAREVVPNGRIHGYLAVEKLNMVPARDNYKGLTPTFAFHARAPVFSWREANSYCGRMEYRREIMAARREGLPET